MTPFIRLDITSFLELLESTSASSLELCLSAQEILSQNPNSAERAQKRLAFLSHEFRAYSLGIVDTLEALSALNEFLFREKKFEAVDEDTAGAEHVLISRVLENRSGIALTLSLIYRDLIQRRGGQRAEFVSFPGASLVKVLYNHQLLFLDPGQDGKLLSVADLQARLMRRQGKSALLNGNYLETPSEILIAARFLNHLKSVFLESREWESLLAVLDMLIAIAPSRMGEYKERGLLLFQLGMVDDSYRDLRLFIDRSRPSPEIESLKNLLIHIDDPSVTPLF